MKYGDSMTEHSNAFNIMVSYLLYVDINISDEDKCINLFFSLPNSWDSLVVAIGSNSTILSFDDVVILVFGGYDEKTWKSRAHMPYLQEDYHRKEINLSPQVGDLHLGEYLNLLENL
jgi:hypothetical protein